MKSRETGASLLVVLLAAALLIVGAVATWMLVGRGGEPQAPEPVPAQAQQPQVAAQPDKPQALPQPLPQQQANGAYVDGPGIRGLPPTRPIDTLAPDAPAAQFSNGTKVPLLNGVTGPVTINWPALHPWSPIKGIAKQEGQDWYLHQDGSWSTTVMRADATGKMQATGIVFPAVPQTKRDMPDPRPIGNRPAPQMLRDR